VLSRGCQAVELSHDHKPNRPSERHRIEALGGTVRWHGLVDKKQQPVFFAGCYRVNGNLSLSRSLGDVYQRPYITNDPDIRTVTTQSEDEFIICATDGLWDVMSSQDAVDFIHVLYIII
jgi:protein phosphatase 2C